MRWQHELPKVAEWSWTQVYFGHVLAKSATKMISIHTEAQIYPTLFSSSPSFTPVHILDAPARTSYNFGNVIHFILTRAPHSSEPRSPRDIYTCTCLKSQRSKYWVLTILALWFHPREKAGYTVMRGSCFNQDCIINEIIHDQIERIW
jgi:hypothetical protein